MKTNNKIVVACGRYRHTINTNKAQTITVWKLGSESKGWIPSKKHFDAFKKSLAFAMKDPSKNHIVFHFGVQVQQVKI